MNDNQSMMQDHIPSAILFDGLCHAFSVVLSGCDNQVSGVSLAKMLMRLSSCAYVMCKAGDGESKKVYVKSHMINHPLLLGE